MNKKIEAVEEFDKYIEKTNLEVSRDLIRMKKAELLIDLKEYEKALDIYIKVLESSPYSKEVCKNRISFLEWEISQNFKRKSQ